MFGFATLVKRTKFKIVNMTIGHLHVEAKETHVVNGETCLGCQNVDTVFCDRDFQLLLRLEARRGVNKFQPHGKTRSCKTISVHILSKVCIHIYI